MSKSAWSLPARSPINRRALCDVTNYDDNFPPLASRTVISKKLPGPLGSLSVEDEDLIPAIVVAPPVSPVGVNPSKQVTPAPVDRISPTTIIDNFDDLGAVIEDTLFFNNAKAVNHRAAVLKPRKPSNRRRRPSKKAIAKAAKKAMLAEAAGRKITASKAIRSERINKMEMLSAVWDNVVSDDVSRMKASSITVVKTHENCTDKPKIVKHKAPLCHASLPKEVRTPSKGSSNRFAVLATIGEDFHCGYPPSPTQYQLPSTPAANASAAPSRREGMFWRAIRFIGGVIATGAAVVKTAIGAVRYLLL